MADSGRNKTDTRETSPVAPPSGEAIVREAVRPGLGAREDEGAVFRILADELNEIIYSLDAEGNILEAETIGEIVIRGENVTLGYENNPEANQKAFAFNWFHTGDQGFKDSDGYLFITGRLKEIINRGGEKISPREIDEVLLEHPDVAQAVAFAVPHITLGEDLAAAVVLKANAQVEAKELRDFVFKHLADFKVPSQIVIVNDIPKGPTGKLQRIGLYKKLELDLEGKFVPPRNELESAITIPSSGS